MKLLSTLLTMMFLMSCSKAWTGPSSAEGKKLLEHFRKAQTSELKAMLHQQDLDLKEFKKTQKTAKSEKKAAETEARHKFFAEHPKSAERRVYVKEYVKRMQDFDKEQDAALKAHREETRIAREALLKKQSENRKTFEDVLKKGTLPEESLWPVSGR